MVVLLNPFRSETSCGGGQRENHGERDESALQARAAPIIPPPENAARFRPPHKVEVKWWFCLNAFRSETSYGGDQRENHGERRERSAGGRGPRRWFCLNAFRSETSRGGAQRSRPLPTRDL